MPQTVYLLCALTSLVCTTLLWRAYGRSRTRLLFWSGLAFVGFAANNALLFVDLVVVPTAIDLSLLRAATAFVAVVVLLFGLVWEGAQRP